MLWGLLSFKQHLLLGRSKSKPPGRRNQAESASAHRSIDATNKYIDTSNLAEEEDATWESRRSHVCFIFESENLPGLRFGSFYALCLPGLPSKIYRSSTSHCF
jgi:hypothetical protein